MVSTLENRKKVRSGALIEKFDTESGLLQPIGHIAPPFFRIFPDIEYPDQRDLKVTPRLKFGLKPKHYRYQDSTLGLELECMMYDHSLQFKHFSDFQDDGYIHPMTEFFRYMLEVGTNPEKGGVYSDIESGLKIHQSVNKYLAGLAAKEDMYIYIGGCVPHGVSTVEDVSLHNEYLRRISIWLAQRRNTKSVGISDDWLTEKISEIDAQIDDKYLESLHLFTTLYGVMTFQPMVLVPSFDGDFCINAINKLNGPIYLSLMAVLATSPFFMGRNTGYKFYRGEVRHMYKTGLYTPEIKAWNEGTRERAMKHLHSGQGINLGRAILSNSKTCLSNGLFRIRPDIGGIEICGLDAHPLAEVRAAVAELFKLMIHYHSAVYCGEYAVDKILTSLWGPMNSRSYYVNYAEMTKKGIRAEFKIGGKRYGAEEVLKIALDRMRKYAEQFDLINMERFDTLIVRPILSQFEYSDDQIRDLTFSELFRKSKKSHSAPNIADMFCVKSEQHGLEDCMKLYMSAFIKENI